MTDLHATAAELIVEVHEGHLARAAARIATSDADDLRDLALILAAQGSPDREMRDLRAITPEAIVATALGAVGAHYGIRPSELVAQRRDRYLAIPRHIVCWIAYNSGASYPGVARVMGRDHKTVMHSVRRVEADASLLAMARVIRDGTKEGAA